MFSKLLSLLFPETNYEKTIASIKCLEPSPFVITTLSGHSVVTCARYDEPHMRVTIKVLKKHGTEHSVQLLAHLLGDVLLEDLADSVIWHPAETIIVPMPISSKRARERGFNQMEKIVDALPTTLRAFVNKDVLIRVHNTRMQKTLSREERLHNVTDAFAVPNENTVRSKHIILIDDVVATGATIGAAAQALQSAGACHITLVALARA